MGISNPDTSNSTRRQAWIGLLLLSAALAAAGWFGTYHQTLSERHAYARCVEAAGACARPDSSPVWAFASVAVAFVALAGLLAVRRNAGGSQRRPVVTRTLSNVTD